MTNNNNNSNSWTKDFRAAILLPGAEDRSQPPGSRQQEQFPQQKPHRGGGRHRDPQPQPGRGQCCHPSSSYGPAPPPPPPHATRLSPGTPGTASPPELGAAGAGGGGRGASFPHIPAELGGYRGHWPPAHPPRPPLPTPEVRTGFQAQVQTAVATGGGEPRAAPRPRTRHTPHAQTDRQRHRRRSWGALRAAGESQGFPVREGLGGCFFGYRALKTAVFQASEEAQCPQGPLPPALPRTAGWGGRQFSFPVPPDPLPSPKPLSSQHPRRERAVWVSALQ